MRKDIAKILRRGGVGVLPTDTLYGMVGSALKKETVERIYRLRKRSPKKPFIILIGSLTDLKKFNIRISTGDGVMTRHYTGMRPHAIGQGAHPSRISSRLLRMLWPGKVSIVLPCRMKKFAYLHRGTKTLAFRMPK